MAHLLFLAPCCLPLALPLGTVAADPPPMRSQSGAERELLTRDLRLTMSARKALQEDKELASCSIGVNVREGVAELWGRVPTEILAEAPCSG